MVPSLIQNLVWDFYVATLSNVCPQELELRAAGHSGMDRGTAGGGHFCRQFPSPREVSALLD